MFSITSSVDELPAETEIVVVGSGYGGAVAASRMARAGREVCLLERGEEWLPGEFPDTEEEAAGEIQLDLPEEHEGPATGLYDFHVNPEISVLVGCGLGGTSLINANVVIEPTDEIFADDEWPTELRDPETGEFPLRRGFDRARQMLEPRPYPEDADQPDLPKLEALGESAEHLDVPLERPDIAVTFEDRINAAGVEQQACTLCGDCVSGCNYGSKNTLLMNYLPDAWNHGAEIFTGTEVRYLEREGDQWRAYYRTHGDGRAKFDAPPSAVVADAVFLAAGSLGSTEILQRSERRGGLDVSDRLGEGFSGNGDALGFAYNTDREVRSIGHGNADPDQMDPVGPCITGAMDFRDRAESSERQLLVEDGVLPGALGALSPAILSAAAGTFGRDTDPGVVDFFEDTGRQAVAALTGPRSGAVENTQVYLAMGKDSGEGRMELSDDRLRIRWPGATDEPVFDAIDELLEEATEALGGTYIPNPLWANWFDQSLITVHPLGGCRMGDGPDEGVVDDRGRVFKPTASGGGEVYDDLVVCDGSTVPGSVGANPLLTITALAERSCALFAEQYGWDYDADPVEEPIEPPSERAVSVSFTERMSGWISTEVGSEDPLEDVPEQERSPCEFVVTIRVEDVDSWSDDPGGEVPLSGTVDCPALSDEALVVDRGRFRLLRDDPSKVDTRRMEYEMDLRAESGESYRFEGVKTVRDDPELDVWSDTTTLDTTVRQSGEDGEVVARGVLEIDLVDLARQLTTVGVSGADGLQQRLQAVATFGRTFAGKLFDIYGGVFGGPEDEEPTDARRWADRSQPRKRRPLRAPQPTAHPFRADDGTELLLTRSQGGDRGPVMLSHGLGVSSRIFSLDTVDTNLVEYLVGHGWDVWLLDYRSSIELPASRSSYDGDDVARRDYPAAVDEVRRLTGAEAIDVVAHCFGSTTMIMAMLDGLEGVESIVASQIATHVESPFLTELKSGVHVPSVLENVGFDSLTARPGEDTPWYERAFDAALELYPGGEPEDESDNPVAKRVTFLYGQLWELDQLNDPTHDNLGELFGLASIDAFQHLAEMVRAGQIVDSEGDDVYLDSPERLDLPITFIHGAENACYLPESTERTVEWLREHNGEGPYERHVVPNYGHIDCIFGKNAAEDVYPLIHDHLERHSPAT